VPKRVVRLVWLERMVFSRSFPWRESVTRPLAGSNAATLPIDVITASLCALL
jgi:hypothetical protein